MGYKVQEEEIEQLMRNLLRGVPRTVRGLGYFLAAYGLTWGAGYDLKSPLGLATAVGILGAGSNSAKIGQVVIVILVAMNLITPTTLNGLSAFITGLRH